mmetsp:Transcript_23103/g.52941  ORF Transcript_23103/g.52941 Transcript_23103/m.52941 type:complete len:255 (+) Transcript_23103:952-1716(+)
MPSTYTRRKRRMRAPDRVFSSPTTPLRSSLVFSRKGIRRTRASCTTRRKRNSFRTINVEGLKLPTLTLATSMTTSMMPSRTRKASMQCSSESSPVKYRRHPSHRSLKHSSTVKKIVKRSSVPSAVPNSSSVLADAVAPMHRPLTRMTQFVTASRSFSAMDDLPSVPKLAMSIAVSTKLDTSFRKASCCSKETKLTRSAPAPESIRSLPSGSMSSAKRLMLMLTLPHLRARVDLLSISSSSEGMALSRAKSCMVR